MNPIRKFIEWRRRKHLAKVLRFLDTHERIRLEDGYLILCRHLWMRESEPLFGESSMRQYMKGVDYLRFLEDEREAVPVTKKWLIPHIQAYINMRS